MYRAVRGAETVSYTHLDVYKRQVYIKHVLHIEDEDVYNAVRYHTTGRKNMTLLEKVIFIADFISKDRNYPGVEDMRKAAYKSLDKAIVEGIAFTITELAKDRAPIVPETIDAYNDACLLYTSRCV